MENRIEAPYFVLFLQFLSPSLILLAFSFINQLFHIVDTFPKIQCVSLFLFTLDSLSMTSFLYFPCPFCFAPWFQ